MRLQQLQRDTKRTYCAQHPWTTAQLAGELFTPEVRMLAIVVRATSSRG